jgi:hypothetical protein
MQHMWQHSMTGKPDDIPLDVWAAAWAVWQPHRKPIPSAAIELVARTIMAAKAEQREADAKICDAEAARRIHNGNLAWKGDPAWGYDTKAAAVAQDNKAITAQALAAAIRKGSA